MKKVLVLVISILVLAPTVSAHVLKTDGEIGAVMHVTPEDDPVAGDTSFFFFEIKDRQNNFKPGDCDCRVRILHQGAVLTESNTFENFRYVFPMRSVYTIELAGQPKTEGLFQTFSLKYDLRVDKGTDIEILDHSGMSEPTESNPLAYYVIFGIVILAIIFLLFRGKKVKK